MCGGSFRELKWPASGPKRRRFDGEYSEGDERECALLVAVAGDG